MNGPQPISLSDINAYCEITNVSDREDREDLMRFVSMLDDYWLGQTYEKQRREMDRQKAKNSRKA